MAHCTLAEAAQWGMIQCLNASTPKLIVTLNPEIVVQAELRPELKQALKNADLCVADGVGITWAARHFGANLPERVPGV